MHLSEVFAENFRVFGAADAEPAKDQSLRLALQPGINVLVGENDSGKTAIIDAIRYCLWTTSFDYHRFTADDFHCHSSGRNDELTIRCKFSGLTEEDESAFLEWLTTPPGEPPVLYITLHARLVDIGNGKQRIPVTVHAGADGEGPALEGTVREMIRSTYLRPLRDADAELSPGRNSRLSQILASHPDIGTQAEDDFDSKLDKAFTLVGIMRRAEHHVGRNKAVVAARDNINTQYLSHLAIADDKLIGEIGVSGSSLRDILEKLELRIAPPSECAEWTQRGLGFNNALFMAAELLLLEAAEVCPTLLIEEPEAHLHPQLQARVLDLLQSRSDPKEGKPVQVILTTHSPNVASSVPLGRLTLVCAGRTFSLTSDETMLEQGDYAFLERFLDVTKANLFFAKGVVIVEGDGESLLLPAIAQGLGQSLSRLGVSVVKVGHTGLFRYSNIFRRKDEAVLPVHVACLRDRDVVPNELQDDLRGKLKRESDLTKEGRDKIIANLTRRDGGSVRTFVSDFWTFEYDLARSSWKMAGVMHQAVCCAKQDPEEPLDEDSFKKVCAGARQSIDELEAHGKALAEVALDVYLPLKRDGVSKAVTAQYAARILNDVPISEEDLPAYIRSAFDYLTAEKGATECGEQAV